MDIAEFKKLPILGIMRGITRDALDPLIEAIIQSGLKTIEITMNTEGAAELIRRAVRIAKGRMTIGAGTVLDKVGLQTALSAGASFIVMPTVVKEVVDTCVKKKIPVFPGALTPQEIYQAWRSGATMVKVFPAKCFGPEYFREIKGPFQDIELLACAGVTPENLGAYFTSGASAVSFGASVFKKEWIDKQEFLRITAAITGYITAYKEHQQ